MTWRVRAAVALAWGVLATVVSAWVCVFFPDPQSPPAPSTITFPSADEPLSWEITVRRAAWFTWVAQSGTPAMRSPSQPPPSRAELALLRQQVPSWASDMVFRAPTAEDLSARRGTVQVALGWPFRSMYGRMTVARGGPPDESPWPPDLHHYVGPPAESVTGLDLRPLFGGPLDADGHSKRYSPSSKILPLRPMWPGFAVNTLFLALAFFAPWSALVGLRNWRRARRLARGLCPRCCYPVTGAQVCAECGDVVR
jgi:hypothetical protein